MKKQKKQNLLTTIIIILVFALIMLVGSIVYEEIINMNKKTIKDTSISDVQEDNQNKQEEADEELPTIETEDEEEIKDDEKQEEYVGEEEQTPKEDSEQNIDEKAIQLAKKEWGEDDAVIFSIVDKKDSKYRISVTKEATVLKWYEVDTKTWEISEY